MVTLAEMMELPQLVSQEIPEAGTAVYYKLSEGKKKKTNQQTLNQARLNEERMEMSRTINSCIPVLAPQQVQLSQQK